MNQPQVVCIVVAVLLLIWMWCQMSSVRVYRFYRPGCPWCVKSKDEWDKFKRQNILTGVKCVDVNLDNKESDSKVKKLADTFVVSKVPTVMAVYDDGLITKHDGDRTAEGYKRWLSRHGDY